MPKWSKREMESEAQVDLGLRSANKNTWPVRNFEILASKNPTFSIHTTTIITTTATTTTPY
jgi:hypothetical protein